MKYWIFNHYASTPDQPMTGSYYFAKALQERGNQVSIFASSFNYYQRKEIRLRALQLFRREPSSGLQFIWTRTLPYDKSIIFRMINLVSYFFSSLLTMFFIKPKPDYIIGTCPHLFGVLAAYIASKIYRAKFVFEVRDLWPQTFVDHGRLKNSSWLIRILRRLERFLYSKSDLILTVLPLVKNYIESTGVSGKKVLWIPNGIDFNLVSEVPPMTKDQQKTFMYLGGHADYQGLYTLLDAAEILSDHDQDFKLILIGNGVEKDNLINYANERNIRNVDFREAVPRSHLPKVMEEAGCFIYHLKHFDALKYGISPNKLCDYMISKRPIICAVKAPNTPVLDAEAGICIDPEDSTLMADAIMKMLRIPFEEKVKLGQNGYAYAKKNYDVSVLVKKFEDALI